MSLRWRVGEKITTNIASNTPSPIQRTYAQRRFGDGKGDWGTATGGGGGFDISVTKLRVPFPARRSLTDLCSPFYPPQLMDIREPDGHLVRELHGITLERIVRYLEATYGWAGLDERLRLNCFAVNPSVKSSLSFLRRTEWARQKVEALYIQTRERELTKKA
jgi:DNA-binding protein VF530